MVYLPLLRILQISPFYVQSQPKFLQCPIRPLRLDTLLSTLTSFPSSLPLAPSPCYFSSTSSTLPLQGICTCSAPDTCTTPSFTCSNITFPVHLISYGKLLPMSNSYSKYFSFSRWGSGHATPKYGTLTS